MDSSTTGPLAPAPTVVKPTVGRIVYFKSRGSADGVFSPTDRAAIITDVKLEGNATTGFESFQVRLFVINPFGTMHTDWLEQGDKPGNWDWMPFQKDQVARMAPGTLNASHKAA